MFWKRRKREKALDLTKENFNKTITENQLVFVFFKAPWCGACRILSPLVHELADDNWEQDVVVGQVHTDNERELFEQFQIRSLPTLIVFEGSEITYKGSGMISKPRLQEMIDKVLDIKEKTI